MEQEISQREVVKAAWEMLSAKSASLVERIQRRDTKLDETTFFPYSEQQSLRTVLLIFEKHRTSLSWESLTIEFAFEFEFEFEFELDFELDFELKKIELDMS